jgi:peptidoglycan/LPS O-acetylase OafA/YrhL
MVTEPLNAAAPRHRPPDNPAAAVPIPALDGLRAIAVAVVVAYHYNHLSGGFLGVDLFFVLSGYLITRLLLSAYHGGTPIRLRWFWERRVRRLAPALLVLLLSVLVWVHFLDGASLHRLTVGQTRAALVYGSNWYSIFAHLGYFDVHLTGTPLNHLWSLAIEEQFYIVWPLVAIVFLTRLRRPLALAWLALAPAVASLGITPMVFDRFGANAAYLGTETRVGAVLLGSALALFAHHQSTSRRAPSRLMRVYLAVGTLLGAGWFATPV